MKIALICEWLDAWRGGAETSTLQFIHHLRERGADVHVFTRSRPSPAPGLSVHTINGAAMSRTRQSMTFAHRVERRVRSESFDVVHAISPCRFAQVYEPRGGTVAESIERNLALLQSPSVRRLKRYANRLNLKQRYLLGLEREMFAHNAGPIVIAISQYVARQLKRHYDLTDRRIRLVRNGVDPDACDERRRAEHRRDIRREFHVGDDDLLVLVVAHNFRLKGVVHWMESLAALRARGVNRTRSLVIGKGDSPVWRRRAARLGVEGALTFVGPSTRVPAFYHAADVLVHPTYYDPCSRVVLEAMASGLPCVTSRWDGASEIVEPGRNGFVLDDPRDTQALAAAVERLCDAGIRKQIGREAMETAVSQSMAAHVEGLVAVYDEIASGRITSALAE